MISKWLQEGARRWRAYWEDQGRERKAKPVRESSPLLLKGLPKKPTYFFLGLYTIALLGLFARCFYLQIIDTDFLKRQGENRFARTLAIDTVRGEILDRNGVVLASTLPLRTIAADPTVMQRVNPEDLKKLASILEIPYQTIRNKLDHPSSPQYVVLARGQSIARADQVRALRIKGIQIENFVRRVYPDGPVMSHIVGFTGTNGQGQEGVELAQNDVLSGQKGARRVIKDRYGRIVEDVWAKEPNRGNDVTLAIDSRIQFIAYQALQRALERTEAKSASVVVADARTGEILSLVNLPTYDPNNRLSMQFDLVRNRVMTDQFEPGSTMKPFAIAKALDRKIVTPMTTIQTSPGKLKIGDRIIGDVHDYGLLTVAEIVSMSSNIGTAKIALELRPETLWNTYTQLGFGQAVDLGFPGATSGRLRPAKSWRPIEQATISYGHGITVSLIQLVRAYTALARDGEVIDLTLYKRNPRDTIRKKQVFSPQVARSVRAMMMNTVKRGGTASNVKIDGYTVAAKTGTANKVKNGRYVNDVVASIVGIVPATQPRFIVAVMIDEPKRGSHFGGRAAGPVFNTVASGALRTLMVPPDQNVARIQATK